MRRDVNMPTYLVSTWSGLTGFGAGVTAFAGFSGSFRGGGGGGSGSFNNFTSGNRGLRGASL
jgi:hypothetical protein